MFCCLLGQNTKQCLMKHILFHENDIFYIPLLIFCVLETTTNKVRSSRFTTFTCKIQHKITCWSPTPFSGFYCRNLLFFRSLWFLLFPEVKVPPYQILVIFKHKETSWCFNKENLTLRLFWNELEVLSNSPGVTYCWIQNPRRHERLVSSPSWNKNRFIYVQFLSAC